jgi:cation:H+ antiporter
VSILLLVVGAALLYVGGELLVRNAVKLAVRFSISPLVIGLTVVAFGTSSPELAATLASVIDGFPQIAVGNVIGSNIANVGLILGLTAIVYPLMATPKFLSREFLMIMLVGFLTVPVFFDNQVGRVEGFGLLVILAIYLYMLFRQPPDIDPEIEIPPKDAAPPLWRALIGAVLGIGLLVFGARALVAGAVVIARTLGVPEAVIGLTLVAFGTSLPELASSLIAALKKQTDIILGNIVGSNVFNVLAILGITATVTPFEQPYAAIRLDLWVMLGFSAAILPLMIWRNRLGRIGGTLLLTGYLAYVAFLYGMPLPF